MRCERSSGPSGVPQGDVGTDPAAECAATPRDLLPSPLDQLSTSSDLGAQIAGLLVCLSREQKETARQSRQAAEKAQCAAEERELEKMGEEADLKLASGVVQGTAQITSGAMSAGSEGGSDAARTKWTGIGKIAEGGSKIDSAMIDHFASDAARGAKRASFDAGHAKTAIDDARDLDKDAKEIMTRALGYYKEYMTAKADTQRATLLKA